MMDCLRSSCTISPHHYEVNIEIDSESLIERRLRCSWRSRSRDLRDAQSGHDRDSLEINLEAEID